MTARYYERNECITASVAVTACDLSRANNERGSRFMATTARARARALDMQRDNWNSRYNRAAAALFSVRERCSLPNVRFYRIALPTLIYENGISKAKEVKLLRRFAHSLSKDDALRRRNQFLISTDNGNYFSKVYTSFALQTLIRITIVTRGPRYSLAAIYRVICIMYWRGRWRASGFELEADGTLRDSGGMIRVAAEGSCAM